MMNYKLTRPCKDCPFLEANAKHYRMLKDFASGEFPCHKASELVEDGEGGGEFHAKSDGSTPHCAGALIYNEKRNRPHQMMRINERLGRYDHTKLDMSAPVV